MTKTCGMNCSIAVRLGGIGRSTDICAISGLGRLVVWEKSVLNSYTSLFREFYIST